MERRSVNAANAPQPFGYAQVCEVSDVKRWAFVSGQIPQSADGIVPETFEAQCRQVWTNVETQLKAVDMSLRNIVKVTMFLADRKYSLESRAIRKEILGSHAPALTVIISGIFDSKWLLEIEVVAAA
jgi:enamine deaminase RidA (YjgF/YER057c/UK114 family)